MMRPLALAALLASAAFAGDPPVNDKCPLMQGKPIKPGIWSNHEGKRIGFCCQKCKGRFDSDPKAAIASSGELQEIFKPPATVPEVGKTAPDFTLKDTAGKEVKLADLKGKIVVIEWLGVGCKASSRHAKSGLVTKLGQEVAAASADAVVLTMSSTQGVDAKLFGKFLTDNKVEARGLVDADGAVAKAFGVGFTAVAVVIDAEGVIRYSGAPDDDPDGKKGAKAVNYVVAAVTALVKGEKIKVETTKSYGTALNPKK